MPIDVNTISLVVMEAFGVAFFLSALIFLKQFQKVEALRRNLEKVREHEKNWKPCYSYKWAMRRTVKGRSSLGRFMRLIGPGALMFNGILALAVLISIGFLIVLSSTGYTLLLSLVGGAIFFQTDAFEAYSYRKAVEKVPIDELRKEDQTYMETASNAFTKAALRSLIIGTIFVAAGPFIPQLFHHLCYILVQYMRYTLFSAVDPVWKVSKALGVLITLLLPGILLYLPELIGRKLSRKAIDLIRRNLLH